MDGTEQTLAARNARNVSFADSSSDLWFCSGSREASREAWAGGAGGRVIGHSAGQRVVRAGIPLSGDFHRGRAYVQS